MEGGKKKEERGERREERREKEKGERGRWKWLIGEKVK